MARAGVASRREAERMIVEGRVTVNGKKVASPALDIKPTDKIVIDGKPMDEPQETRLWIYYKPVGLVTTESDEKGRQTVFDALPRDLPRVMTVGRLDLNSEGLLLLTNDGELKRRLELPSTGWLRRYRVRVNGNPTELTFDPLRRGVTIDGEDFQPMEVKLDSQQGANAWLTVGIREGRNREIRRAMSHVGLQVNRLIRIGYGPFKLTGMEANQVTEVKRRVLRDQLGGLLTGDMDQKPRANNARRAAGEKPLGERDRDGGGRFERGDRGDRAERGDRGDRFDRKPRAPRERQGDVGEVMTEGFKRRPRPEGERPARSFDRPARDGDAARKPRWKKSDGDGPRNREGFGNREGREGYGNREGREGREGSGNRDRREGFGNREWREGGEGFTPRGPRRDGDDARPFARKPGGPRPARFGDKSDRPRFGGGSQDDRRKFGNRDKQAEQSGDREGGFRGPRFNRDERSGERSGDSAGGPRKFGNKFGSSKPRPSRDGDERGADRAPRAPRERDDARKSGGQSFGRPRKADGSGSGFGPKPGVRGGPGGSRGPKPFGGGGKPGGGPRGPGNGPRRPRSE
ncbi:MAG: RNA pseudouridine synthase [Paracoccus denitrificans]|nr:MAG: RNA pseudouridine synthase [Paracoccus denitrificans]PZO82904.1 MAG: RNA pseudouridine synthase [Paracoccus denitrificans]